jgi:polyhydroxybutyrate depolymerase
VTRRARIAFALMALFAIACGGSSGGGAAGGPNGGEPFSEVGCEAATPGAPTGSTTVMAIEHDGLARSYRLYVPTAYQPGAPTPLVLNWHGLTSNAVQEEVYTGTAIAEERGVIVAYPDGLGSPGGQSFNGGNCCSRLGNPPHEADDVGFGRAIVADVASRLCVDRKRIYSTGMSNGGYMTDYNACEAADLYAAVAPVSALGIPRTQCAPSRPIPILSFNGTDDPLVRYDVSQASMRAWAERNGCTGEPTRTDHGASYCDVWSDCAAGVAVEACTITGMQHCWPGNPLAIRAYCQSGGLDDIDANRLMYDFFARHALP